MSEVVIPKRKRTLIELQPYIVTYGAAISLFSPLASIYQLGKLNPKAPLSVAQMFRYSAIVFPAQTILKSIQMNIGTPIKDILNPWAAFAVIGMIQGGVYGQANIYFSKQMGIAKSASLAGMFRGVLFAGSRDMISQGVPFMLSPYVREYVFDPIFPSDSSTESGQTAGIVKHWAALLSTSVVATVASQAFQNGQITMQANQSLGYLGTVQKLWAENGIKTFYRGSEARIGLLLVVSILNEKILKPAWNGV